MTPPFRWGIILSGTATDATKRSQTRATAALWRYGAVADIDVLVTDASADPALISQVQAAGPQVAVVRA